MSEAGSKRSSEGGVDSGAKRAKGDHLTLRFLLYSKHAGGIIGKGGETIKRLRSDYSAQIFVPDGASNERVLSMGAETDNCLQVFRECLPLMHEPPYRVSSGPAADSKNPESFEVDFLVHSSQVGGIIGKAGAKIKQIREDNGAGIKVYPDCLPNSKERVVAISGGIEQLIGALQEILQTMQEQPIKGDVILYDPQGADDGGNFNDMPDMHGANGPPMGAGGGAGGYGGGAQGGGGYGGPPQNYGNNYGNDNYSNNFNNQRPQGGGVGGGGGGAGGNYGGGGPGMGNKFGGNSGGGQGGGSTTSSTQVTIPNDMAGAIIGQGGKRIQDIRQKCGAQIKFADPEPGKKDRLITISGTDDQIQYAQYLMQQCVQHP